MELKQWLIPVSLCALMACGGEDKVYSGGEEVTPGSGALEEIEEVESIEVALSPEPMEVVDFEGIPYAQLVEADTDFPEHDDSLDFERQIELLNTEFYRVQSLVHSNAAALSTSISIGEATSSNAIVDSEHQRMDSYYQTCFDPNSAFYDNALAYKFCGVLYSPVDDGFLLTYIGTGREKYGISFTSYDNQGNAVAWGVNVHDDDSLSIDYLPPTSNGGAFRCMTQDIARGGFYTKNYCATLLEGVLSTLSRL